jgi:hypothetical protein
MVEHPKTNGGLRRKTWRFDLLMFKLSKQALRWAQLHHNPKTSSIS